MKKCFAPTQLFSEISIDPDVKAIVSSGYFNDPVVNDFTKYRFKGAITKPYGIKG